jgi:hypothetical protein
VLPSLVSRPSPRHKLSAKAKVKDICKEKPKFYNTNKNKVYLPEGVKLSELIK